jgi:hypothetical protein
MSYGLGLTFTKISILLLYLRLFATSRTRYGCYILLGVVIIYGTWLFFSSIFPCVPIRRFWDKSIPGHCLAFTPIWFTNASLNIATDLAIFVLPQRTIYALSLPKGQKISLCLVFALGFLYAPPLPLAIDKKAALNVPSPLETFQLLLLQLVPMAAEHC